MTENLFTHNLNTVYHIKTLFVYKFIRRAKLFLDIVLMRTLEYRNRLFEYHFPVVQTEVIALQCKSLLGGAKIYKMLATNSRPHSY